MASVTFTKNNQSIIDVVLTPADFDAEGMWYTDSINTLNVDKVTATVKYADLSPDGDQTAVGYRLQAVLEGQEDDGSWDPLVSQINPLSRSDQAFLRRMVASANITNYSPGEEHFIPDALQREKIGITSEQIDIPDKVRVAISMGIRDANQAPLNSVKVTITGFLI